MEQDPGLPTHTVYRPQDLSKLKGQKLPIYAYKDGMGHGGTYREPNGGELGKIASALLLWQLKGDKEAAKMFEGKAAVYVRTQSGTSRRKT